MKESYTVLHDSAESCCRSEFNWIDIELCAARTTKSALEKYWPNKTNGKCYKDSETPAHGLSVRIFDSVEDCCRMGVSW